MIFSPFVGHHRAPLWRQFGSRPFFIVLYSRTRRIRNLTAGLIGNTLGNLD